MTINSFSRSFLCVCVCVCVCALVAQLCATLCELMPLGLMSLVLLCPCDSPGKNTGEGWHFLLQGKFPTQGSNPGLLHCRQILYHLSHQGSPTISLYKGCRGSFLQGLIFNSLVISPIKNFLMIPSLLRFCKLLFGFTFPHFQPPSYLLLANSPPTFFFWEAIWISIDEQIH